MHIPLYSVSVVDKNTHGMSRTGGSTYSFGWKLNCTISVSFDEFLKDLSSRTSEVHVTDELADRFYSLKPDLERTIFAAAKEAYESKLDEMCGIGRAPPNTSWEEKLPSPSDTSKLDHHPCARDTHNEYTCLSHAILVRFAFFMVFVWAILLNRVESSPQHAFRVFHLFRPVKAMKSTC